LFRQTGGFDESFNRLEDYEFGFRLLQSGARLVYVPEAVGLHHDSMDLPQWIQRIRDEGIADVQLATRHPILRRKLFGNPKLRGTVGLIQRLAFVMHGRGDALVKAGLRIAAVLESLGLRPRRRSVVYAVRLFNYWRGVAAAAGSMAKFTEWTEEETYAAVLTAGAPRLEWTTQATVSSIEEILRDGSRKGIRILLGGIEVLAIAPEPWSEPLRPEHIELALCRLPAEQFVPALLSTCLENWLVRT
ncbi:MAG: hypothetical protein JOY79_07075, partial [Acidobacteriaceae bacterium]|nr:hypothetical protein [Acidobacteriaceae bacterium]